MPSRHFLDFRLTPQPHGQIAFGIFSDILELGQSTGAGSSLALDVRTDRGDAKLASVEFWLSFGRVCQPDSTANNLFLTAIPDNP
jgi:hypothetical protein